MVPLLAATVFLGLVTLAPATSQGESNCYYEITRAKAPSLGDINSCFRVQSDLFKRHASSQDGARYLYRMGRLQTLLYDKTGRPAFIDQAIDSYRRLVKRYPHSSLADDAQYNIGLIFLHDRNDKVDAYVEFLKVEVEHPQGDMVPKAKQKLRELGRSIKSEEEAPEPSPSQGPLMGRPQPEPSPMHADGIPRVVGLRHWSTATYTRVVVDLTGPVKFDSHFLRPDPGKDLPARLFIDLKNTRMGNLAQREIEIANAHLRKARLGQNDANTVRVVLDIQDISGHKAFLMHSPERLVIDVVGPNAGGVQAGGQTASLPPGPSVGSAKKPGPGKIPPSKSKGKRVPRGPADDEAGPSQLIKAFGLGVRTVVIDPGHGGKDPGALTCQKGLMEKDIVLKVSHKLAYYLRKKLGLKVIMTRTKDSFISLEERTAIANTTNADLFISIHVNAAHNRRLHGVETYFLNLATDERSIQLAARENATTTKSISDLQHILNDLMLNTKINESNRLAFQTQRSIMNTLKKSYPRVKSLGVKQAPFYVLLGAQMPAVLVEIGFGTNPAECRHLASTKYLNKVAEGISRGLAEFIRQSKAGK